MADANPTSKTCTKCGILKSLDLFFNKSGRSDGKTSHCKECFSKKTKEYKVENKEYLSQKNREWYERTKEERKSLVKEYRERNKERDSVKRKIYYENNPDKKIERQLKTSEWRRNNPEKVAKKAKRWAEKNPEVKKRIIDCWRQENREWTREYSRIYAQENPEIVAANWVARKTSQKRSVVPWANQQEIREIYKKSKLLEKETGIKHHVDHRVPLRGKTVCGIHCEANLQILTEYENISKGNRYWPDMW